VRSAELASNPSRPTVSRFGAVADQRVGLPYWVRSAEPRVTSAARFRDARLHPCQ